mgnify:CR=1 FL=1
MSIYFIEIYWARIADLGRSVGIRAALEPKQYGNARVAGDSCSFHLERGG